MFIYLHRLRERGRSIPKYQFAFKQPVHARLTVHETFDPVLNRQTRIARLADPISGQMLDIPPLHDTQLVGLTKEFMSLSGIERVEDDLGLGTNDYAQTWLCLLEMGD